MSVIITSQRYNWMGYNGTESQAVDAALLRGAGAGSDNYSYEHRQRVIAELKERLYQIKHDLDLLPEEELRAEEETKQRRKAERKRREEEARRQAQEEDSRRQEEQARQRAEEQERAEEHRRQQQEDEQRRRESEEEAQKNAQRWKQLHDDSDDDSDVEEEESAALETIPRSQGEIDGAVRSFTAGTRVLLASAGQGYVSYLDGTVHASIADLEDYNDSEREAVEAALAGTAVALPSEQEFSVEELHASAEAQQAARKKLDAFRVAQDPTYAARIRASEKNASGQPTHELTAADGDDQALAAHLNDAKQHAESVRQAYNTKAAASGRTIAGALSSPAPGHPATAVATAPADEPTTVVHHEGSAAPTSADAATAPTLDEDEL